MLGNASCVCRSYEQEQELEDLLLRPDLDLPRVRIVLVFIGSLRLFLLNNCQITSLRKIPASNRNHRVINEEDLDTIQSRSSFSACPILFWGHASSFRVWLKQLC